MRAEKTSQPENSSAWGISTKAVMASQKASQFRPYQLGKLSELHSVEWSSSALLMLLRSILMRAGLVMYSPLMQLGKAYANTTPLKV